MSLRDQIAHDEGAAFFGDGALDDQAELWPDGDSAAAFEVLASMGEAPEQLVDIEHFGQAMQRLAQALLMSACVVSGLSEKTGTPRDLRRGDALFFDAGEYRGLWMVDAVTHTAGGNFDARLVYQQADRAAGRLIMRGP